MKSIQYIRTILYCALSAVSSAGFAQLDLTPLSDDELAQTEGQALFNLSYLAPSDAGNFETANNIGFYRLGLEAQLDLNINARKLQLGCGGINGAGGCDIDIDNLSLSGFGNTRDERASSSARLTNPFVEFAIRNPDSASTREITGFRLSAAQVSGLLTAGLNDGTPNGINSLSGYLPIAATTGTTQTAVGNFNQTLEGLLTTGSCGTGLTRNASCAGFRTTGGGLTIGSQSVNFNVPAFVVNGKRLSSIPVSANALIGAIPITDASGSFSAQTVDMTATDGTTYNSCLFVFVCDLPLSQVRLNTRLTNIGVQINLQQSLGLVHRIPLNNPASLSIQKQNLRWPGQVDTAQQGWWLAVSDPVQLGSLSTPAGFQVDISSVFPQVAGQVNTYLRTRANAIEVPFGSAVGALFTGRIGLDVPDINLAGNTSSLNLTNLPLGVSQDVVPNCFGTLTFC